jgi:hypothetical protein
MPGIVVALRESAVERVRAAVRKLAHLPAHQSGVFSISSKLTIGWAGPPQWIASHAWKGESGEQLHLWRFGQVFRREPAPAAVQASEILSDYVSAGIDSCCDYEGSFVIVIADMGIGSVYVVPDRLCTQPLYYTCEGDDIVVAPEVKALCTVTGSAPRWSRDGVVGFLAAGYNLGAETPFVDIHRLEMGKRLELSLNGHGLNARRFWKLDFSSTDKLVSRRNGEAALFESIKDAHRLLLADEPTFQILLSGGVDSRGMLGACQLLGARPARVITWGVLRRTPRSDASISKALAERFGLRWDFVVTGTEGFVDNCEQWAYVSELSNDNFGWYSEGLATLQDLQDAGITCSFIGDECWGWYGFARDESHAYSKVLPANVPARLLALMPERERDPAAAAYVEHIRQVMRDCDAADWTDRKDFLYLHGRVARFIFSLGYNRGHVLEQRRPFLTRTVLDVVRRLPAEFRVHKNLYRTMLKRHLPQTMGMPTASVSSLPDWSYDLRARGRLRDLFGQLLHDPLLECGVLGDLLAPGPYRELRDAFFAEMPTPVAREARAAEVLEGHVKEMLWRSPAYKFVDRWTDSRSHIGPRPSPIAPADIMRRIAILVLLERQLHRFVATSAALVNERSSAHAGLKDCGAGSSSSQPTSA